MTTVVGHEMKTKLLTIGLCAAALTAGTTAPAFADGEEAASPWSATLAVTSDYRFRGISQTDRGAAVQGSIDFASETGLFAGVWASNLDFNDPGDTSIEVDLYAGYSYAFSDTTSATLKAIYYAYPDQDNALPDYDYWEFVAGLSHDFGKFALGAELAYSPDFFGEVGDALALTGTLTVPLCDELWFFDGGVSASGHLGEQWFDEPLLIDYLYYDLGLSASAGIFTLDVRWVGTDLDKAECGGGLDWCEDTVVVTGSIKFGG
jgi:uncharacterized protein (TIGR02001 family)